MWVNLVAMAPLLKGMKPIQPEGYTRKDYWAKRKAKFAEEVAAYRAAPKVSEPPDFSDMPPAIKDEEDDLPF